MFPFPPATPDLGLAAVLLAGGAAVLWAGAEGLVRGASRLAARAGLSPLLIGATLVAFGTSLPEWLVSIVAQLKGRPEMALGNVLGSNLCNLGLALGAIALLRPVAVNPVVLKRELAYVLLAGILLLGLSLDRVLDRLDGLVLLLVFAFFYVRLFRLSRPGVTGFVPRTVAGSPWRDAFMAVAGLVLLAAGAEGFVRGAAAFARHFGMSEAMVGATVVAVGTSLPEIVTSLVAGLRGDADISVGNILGSNLFNTLFVGGSLAAVAPVTAGHEILRYHFPWMLAVTAALWPLAFLLGPRPSISRPSGLALAAAYAVYLFGTLPLR